MKKQEVFVGVASVLCLVMVAGHRMGRSDVRSAYVPEAPDYANPTMWITAENDSTGTGADVFYVVSTWEKDWQTEDGCLCHYADVWNAAHREHMGIEINRVAAYMGEGNNFYAPFYRHMTIDGWMTRNSDTISHRVRLSMDDVKRAYDHFQQHRDRRRPFVMAGFSQGGMAMVELLKHMTDDDYRQLVACYVLGYRVTAQDTLDCHRIRAAKDSADVGVTICYNTVKAVRYVPQFIKGTVLCINPVNWRTDATPAMLHDTITVAVDTVEHVLVVKGYSASEYPPYKGFLNVGDIHSCEPWLYSDCLKRNIALRISEWRKH